MPEGRLASAGLLTLLHDRLTQVERTVFMARTRTHHFTPGRAKSFFPAQGRRRRCAAWVLVRIIRPVQSPCRTRSGDAAVTDPQPQAPPEQRPPISRWWYAAIALALFGAALLSTSELVFDPIAQSLWAGNGDSIGIAEGAERAELSDVLGWWSGPWIQGKMYYRPLSSMLFYIEGQLFSTDFRSYCIVSWLAGALNVALLALLGATLARGGRGVKLAVGALTGVLFLLARHPEICQGLDCEPARGARVTWGMMPWWPVQTDLFSLMFATLSLLLLDRWLLGGGRGRLIGSAAAFIAALLFKEMALCIPLMVPLLVLYRRRAAVAQVSGLFVAIGVVFYIIRTLAAPEASGLEWAGTRTLSNFAYYSVNSFWTSVMADTWDAILTPLGLVVLVLVMLWRRIEWVWIVFAIPLWLLLAGQVFAGNFAQYSVLGPWLRMLPGLVFFAGLALLVLVRNRGASPALVIAVAAACVPVLNRTGPHYWYWPLAFYALLNASLLERLWDVIRGRNEALLAPLFSTKPSGDADQSRAVKGADAASEPPSPASDATPGEGNSQP